ncbi:MAG: anhydro-N-acetylmuramic acid kinase, partial [Gammaproteobacteria bacterium]
MDDLYIGLMSGTSMDGVDAALVDLKDGQPKIRATLGKEMPAAIREQLVGFIEQPHKIDLDELGSLDTALGVVFADAAIALLDEVGVPAKKIAAIGSHGQTVRHRPEGEYPFTLQIGDPNVIATRTRICTVADFRRRDVALGGQGAPLTPLFHESVFADPQENRIVLNIGGIANITTLLPDKPVTGFDTGPGNTLMDAWVRRSLGQRCDINGAWAAGGTVVENLLER